MKKKIKQSDLPQISESKDGFRIRLLPLSAYCPEGTHLVDQDGAFSKDEAMP